MTCIALDARMIQSSGIGTVIANTTSRLIARNTHWRFQLIGDPQLLGSFDWSGAANAEIVPFRAPIFSIAEQTGFPLAKLTESRLLWSPNYPTPLRWAKKLLVTIPDMAHLVLPEMRNSLAKQLYARTMFARARRRADVIAYISQFTADEFHRLLGKPRGREQVIHCGVDDAWFSVTPERVRDRPYILFVGNVKQHKNLARLLDAYDRIKADVPHDLVIAGRKEGFITGDNAVLNRIGEFAGRIAFTGYISDTAMKQLYGGADALVLPSLYEGFGLPPVEAMAAGLPALVSRTASLPEVCQDAALYCDPLDVTDIALQLQRLLTDQPLRVSLRDKGRSRARQLSWDNCAQGYEVAINYLLG